MSQGAVVGNNDKCGRCHVRHGGNLNLCRVHGATSRGCCDVSCDPDEWEHVVVRQNGKAPRGRMQPRSRIKPE